MKITFGCVPDDVVEYDRYDFSDPKKVAFGDFLLDSAENHIHIRRPDLMSLADVDRLLWYFTMLLAFDRNGDWGLSFNNPDLLSGMHQENLKKSFASLSEDEETP